MLFVLDMQRVDIDEWPTATELIYTELHTQHRDTDEWPPAPNVSRYGYYDDSDVQRIFKNAKRPRLMACSNNQRTTI